VFSVKLIDAPAQGIDLEQIIELLNDFKPDVLVLDTSTPSIYSDINVGEKIKEKFPDIFIVLVGTHPSALPEETLKINSKINAVAVGEYDYTVRDLVRALKDKTDLGQVNGLVFRQGEGFISNPPRAKIKDLDSLPFVSAVYKKYLDCRNYFFAAANYPFVMIITGRGCPFGCFFCVYPQVMHERGYRARSPENVVEEFKYIVDNFPEVKEIGIEDDCFTADKNRVKRICELLVAGNIKIKWYCNVRGDLDYNLLRLMKKAGCRLVTVGFESGSQNILNSMNKGLKIERYYEFVKDAKKAGVLIHGCIMVGNPGDSKETLAQSYELAKKLNCDSMQFYPLYVYPGTEAFTWAQEKGYLKTSDFSEWLTSEGLHNCVLDLPDFKGKEMVYLCDHYLKKYHLRPGYILMKLRQAVRQPAKGYRSLKSAKVFFTKILKHEV
ncbi:MAG: radical SAM protein, partial [Candidatus Omnitrophica bacterium]|nr:radical SAM protein [Candidatus Omnitrophota bacterium]